MLFAHYNVSFSSNHMIRDARGNPISLIPRRSRMLAMMLPKDGNTVNST
ncbi:hypothetical protein H7U32_02935 [Bifidobacterium pullorum subsp. saeculare]|uniref:Uncharacterized protein n=1 Tax=Bifidobacterium pullorum subsp. saeculare TaxID=78257 RepID=A0A938WXX2_9BIFI|nr:hypothetical protein [Bifidobacterium pullorum subsp. saeculare]